MTDLQTVFVRDTARRLCFRWEGSSLASMEGNRHQVGFNFFSTQVETCRV